ncbi:hypothetical protein E4T43_01668 [Aureobasidium subglaciale]|nr:hypothetical protein E4T43_01668 [Aureobasidium subglaciale]
MLRPPPRALLTALSGLKAHHRQELPKIALYVDEMLKRKPAMAETDGPMDFTYGYQGSGNDKLFEPGYLHKNGSDCSTCEPSGQIVRGDRKSTRPRIHYGVIASGNMLVKDACLRDKIADITGEHCLRLEMEASGLMNGFPCLVIRGICDYADSHKNDRWQNYAAATAAAFAKELLEIVPHKDVDRLKKASEVLQEVEV